MSIEANIQIVKHFFEAIGNYDEHHLLSLVAEDIEWIIPGEGWPLAGTHRGQEELATVLQKASDDVEVSYPKPPEFVAQGDRVIVVGVATGKSKPPTSHSGTIGLRLYRSTRQGGQHP